MSKLDEIYNKVREVPDYAKKTIQGGRLKGMTDIKPMWRIEKLTEIFGICGIGWFYEILNKDIVDGAEGEKIAIVDIALYFKEGGEWSKPIYGTGGSSFITKERNGYYTSDECFKMALTDALSVACKSLGFGADVYYGDSKYDKPKNNKPTSIEPKTISEAQRKRLFALSQGRDDVVKKALNNHGYESSKDVKTTDYDKICTEIQAEIKI